MRCFQPSRRRGQADLKRGRIHRRRTFEVDVQVQIGISDFIFDRRPCTNQTGVLDLGGDVARPRLLNVKPMSSI